MDILLGQETSAMVREQEQRIKDARTKKGMAITAYLEGQGIDLSAMDGNPTRTKTMPDGQVMVMIDEDDGDEDEG